MYQLADAFVQKNINTSFNKIKKKMFSLMRITNENYPYLRPVTNKFCPKSTRDN